MLHTKGEPDLERDVLALTDGRADGALLLRDMDDPLARHLGARGFPFVQVFSRSPSPDVWFVDCDNVAGGRLATEHLLDLGHVRIGHIGGSPHSAAAADRRDGCCQALAARGIEPDLDQFCKGGYAGGDFGPFLAMMARDEAPTALFVWSDDVAIRAMGLLREKRGKRVPEEVSVVGYDGTEICEHTVPRLSSVRQPIYDMAARGVEMLVTQIQKQPVEEKQVLFAPTLVRRESCARPPV
jgi:LacI family transcriptional regulator